MERVEKPSAEQEEINKMAKEEVQQTTRLIIHINLIFPRSVVKPLSEFSAAEYTTFSYLVWRNKALNPT